MAIIKIYERHCAIEDESDIEFLRALDDELSYRVQGAEHMPSFKGYYRQGKFIKWDGFNRLLTERLTFPSGLLQRVQDFYQKWGRKFTTENERPKTTPSAEINILPTLAAMKKDPYAYQLDTVNVAKQYDCGILRLATGAGKSLIAALLTAAFGKRTIIYVIGTDLLYQFHALYSKIFNQKIGIVGDGNCDIRDINIVSAWTAGKALGLKGKDILLDSDDEESINKDKYDDIKEMLRSTKVHIFDECHGCSADTFAAIGKIITPEHIYGMSASPWRDDNSDLLIECLLGKTIVDISASKLIDQGYLVPPIIKFQNVPKSTEKLKKHYQTIYKSYIVDNPVRNRMVVESAQKLVDLGYRTLVLYNTVSHGEILYKEISSKIPCILLSGKDSSEIRENAKRRLEAGEIKLIIASKIWDIGMDLPALSGLVLAGGGKSSVRALQRIGRVIRKWESKKNAAVIDFVDNAPFLKEHSSKRFLIYSTEERFSISWPNKK